MRTSPCSRSFTGWNFRGPEQAAAMPPQAAGLVARLKAAGYRVILATNPIFPAVATESRIRWAGMVPEDFELYTTYEYACRCKPNPDYYRDILSSMALEASECLMVGNDATEDTAAELAGIQVFLITDCLINRENKDLSHWPHGGFDELEKFIFG